MGGRTNEIGLLLVTAIFWSYVSNKRQGLRVVQANSKIAIVRKRKLFIERISRRRKKNEKKRRRRRKKKKRREPLVGWNPSLYHCLPDQTFRTMTVAMNSITNLIPKRSVCVNNRQAAGASSNLERTFDISP